MKTAAAPRSTVAAEERSAVKTAIGGLATQRDFHLARAMTMVIAWLHSGGWAWQICYFLFLVLDLFTCRRMELRDDSFFHEIWGHSEKKKLLALAGCRVAPFT